jgi:metallo-beta-lactamase class B
LGSVKAFLLSLFAIAALAKTPPEWVRPFPPHNIVANVYYVGTEDLACYLIAGSEGHILINSALAESTENLLANIDKLGFRPEDIKILLTNQAHYDHAAGFPEIQRRTKAKILATPLDADLMEAGGAQDPGDGNKFTGYAPLRVDRRLSHGEVVRLGNIALKVHHHHGHSPGSSSYEMRLDDGRMLLFANMATVVVSLTSYPSIVRDYEATFARQKLLDPDLWVAAHRSQYASRPEVTFSGRTEYREAVAKHEQRFLQQRKIELGK